MLPFGYYRLAKPGLRIQQVYARALIPQINEIYVVIIIDQSFLRFS